MSVLVQPEGAQTFKRRWRERERGQEALLLEEDSSTHSFCSLRYDNQSRETTHRCTRSYFTLKERSHKEAPFLMRLRTQTEDSYHSIT